MTTWIRCARQLLRVGVLTVSVVSLLAAGCDKAPLLAPTESTISLTAAATILPSGGSTTLSAVLVEPAGTAVQNGTSVRFVTTLGRVEPAEAQTRNGVATATFFADGSSGIAQVTALSGSASGGGGTSAANVVQITVGSAAVTNVSVQAAPSSVPASGGTVSVTASITGQNNETLRGVPVSFSTTAGTLSATSALTDNNGNATVQLTTNREAVVTAAVGSVSGTVTVRIATPATVTLSVTPGAAGTPTSLTVTPAAGTSANVVISWGDGASQSLGLVAAPRTVTHVYDQPGTYSITAEATDNGETNTTSTIVVVPSRAAPTMTVAPASGTTATTFSFTVTPATTGGVRGVTVDFGDGDSVDLGAITTATVVQHRYSAEGTYVARAAQTDATGGTSAGVVVVTVTP